MLSKAMGTAANPTQVGVIEIMCPIFVAAFWYILFGEEHINWSITIGGFLMSCGSALILYHNS